MNGVKAMACSFALVWLLALSAGTGVLWISLERTRAEVERFDREVRSLNAAQAKELERLDLEVRSLGAVQAAFVETLTRGWRQNATRLDAVEQQATRIEATVVDTIQTSIEKLFPAAPERAIRG